MNNKNILLLAAVILVIAGYLVIKSSDVREKVPVEVVPSEVSFDPRNASYIIDGLSITLVDGVSEVEAAPGSASKIVTRYFGNEAVGDLNGDGRDDTVYLLSHSTGGSGLFYYAVAVLNKVDGYKVTNTFFVGDRISPQSTNIISSEIHVNFAERKPGEPMTVDPSQGAVLLLKVTSEDVLNGLMQ